MEAFFASLARTDREPEPGVQPGRAVRVASIDIGGGTSNYVVFENGRVVDTVTNATRAAPSAIEW